MLTFDRAMLTEHGIHPGKKFEHAYRTHDSWSPLLEDGTSKNTRYGWAADSSGSFLINELERLDQKLHMPLVSVTWGRDIKLREDVSLADDFSSFTVSTYASAGGLGAGQGIGNGKAWIGRNSSQISSVSVDIGKITNPLNPWGLELKYTVMELESAAKLGRPVDQQKYDALALKHEMDVDESVYIGDSSLGYKGLVNQAGVTPQNFTAGSQASILWANKNPDEILADFNFALTTVWTASAWAVVPSDILIPPVAFGQLATQKVSAAGNMSILQYVLKNNLLAEEGVGANLSIRPSKWCVGAGVNGTIGTADGHDRMVVYTNDAERIRYPMTLLQRTPLQYESIWHKCTYFCKLGVVELVYPQTVGYFDGL